MIKWIKSYIASEVNRTISTEIKGIDANVSKFISEYRSSIEKMELKHKRNVENHEVRDIWMWLKSILKNKVSALKI